MDQPGSSNAHSFNYGDLIWAKMKGFPAWPAQVMLPAEDTPTGRIPVMFFGTKETGFMKPSDINPYLTHRHLYEVPRKQKGFNEAVAEIRAHAGIELDDQTDPLFASLRKSPTPPPVLPGLPLPQTKRIRRESGLRMLSDAFITGYERKRANSGASSLKSRASSSASALKKLKNQLKRRRLDSESSGGSRRHKMISGLPEKYNHPDNDFMNFGMNLDGPLDFNMFDEGAGDDARSTRSKRSRGSSKIFEDYITGGGRTRHRSGSTSEIGRGNRSRLISGVSDVFDELMFSGHNELSLHAEQLLQTLDELPSESSEERPGTPEAPAPLPRPAEFCTDCGCECQQLGNRWRCTSKFCLKWSVRDPFDQPSTSTATAPYYSMNGHRSGPLEIKNIPMIKTEPSDNGSTYAASSSPSTSKDKLKRKDGVKKESETVQVKQEPGTSTSNYSNLKTVKTEPITPPRRAKEVELRRVKSPIRERRKVKVISPQPRTRSPVVEKERSNSIEAPKRSQGTRPKQYHVEKTPPVGSNGQRNCTFCNGQVRPQMCGANKHRWRCVDKKCRKWYGWVKNNEEVPRDLGRKGRWKEIGGKFAKKKLSMKSKTVEPSSVSSEEASLLSETPVKRGASPVRNTGPEKKRLGRPPKQHGLKIKLKTAKEKEKEKVEEVKAKRKYTKRKDKANVTLPKKEEPPKPPPSPLSPRQMRYFPCAMEKRARWWTSEKRRVDVSPVREFVATPADSAASFRLLCHAFRAAAVTRADEIGTVSGTVDLLMDSLLASMAPLLSLLKILPEMQVDPSLFPKMWESSAVHLPLFQ